MSDRYQPNKNDLSTTNYGKVQKEIVDVFYKHLTIAGIAIVGIDYITQAIFFATKFTYRDVYSKTDTLFALLLFAAKIPLHIHIIHLTIAVRQEMDVFTNSITYVPNKKIKEMIVHEGLRPPLLFSVLLACAYYEMVLGNGLIARTGGICSIVGYEFLIASLRNLFRTALLQQLLACENGTNK